MMDNKTLHETVGAFADDLVLEKIDEDGEEQDGSTEK